MNKEMEAKAGKKVSARIRKMYLQQELPRLFRELGADTVQRELDRYKELSTQAKNLHDE